MAYVPEPTHPLSVDAKGTDLNLTAQLQREFEAIRNNFVQLTDFVRGAIAWKGFMVQLDGAGGAVGGAPNTTLPILTDTYNIDLTYGTGGVIRVSEGLYEFKLLLTTIGGEDVLENVFPQFTAQIWSDNMDITAEGFRLQFEGLGSGIVRFLVQQQEVPPSGKAVWEPYDLRDTVAGKDVVWSTAQMNITGRAASYGNTP